MKRPLTTRLRTAALVLLPVLLVACNPGGNRTGSVNDIDGNTYRTVTIGDKTWMSENLRVSHYRNGDPIPEVRDQQAWGTLKSGAWSTYDLSEDNGKKYGNLYNWHAVNDPRGLAPQGWHVASEKEWSALVEATGGEQQAGASLKAAGKWSGASNSQPAGFDALPAGARRDTDGSFLMIGQFARFWTSTAAGEAKAIARAMGFYDDAVRSGEVKMENGFSVRCVKD
ncbi:MAG: hypothetical protein HGB01_00095 [Chlorobiaceae bacterium]|nr:hypothetical protein [Chlorobiaceae bacterium]NTV24592.1 hypothetical protein [Chlorobiaceae bacterium]